MCAGPLPLISSVASLAPAVASNPKRHTTPGCPFHWQPRFSHPLLGIAQPLALPLRQSGQWVFLVSLRFRFGFSTTVLVLISLLVEEVERRDCMQLTASLPVCPGSFLFFPTFFHTLVMSWGLHNHLLDTTYSCGYQNPPALFAVCPLGLAEDGHDVLCVLWAVGLSL